MIKKHLSLAALAACTAAGFQSASAATIAITNHSFESAVTNSVGTTPTGWTAEAAGGLVNLDASDVSYTDNTNGLDGAQVAFWTSGSDIAGRGLSQVLSGEKALDNTTYTLTLGLGERNFTTRFSGLTIELRLADDTVLGSAQFGLNDVTFATAAENGEVVDVSANFNLADVDNTQDLKVVLLAGGGTSGGSTGRQSIDIDNVRLEYTAIPEPSATALLGLGGMTLLLRRRR
ncbi:PEP-CTERM sorting domain-containing protein [Rubritalea tangerina]|uniref:PEP-CTERM sorting domain-containing protein n=1 Tax=Rubritalea tangerina TaxID=430798 RepID=A0ABW4Z9I1_9BACT